MFLTASVHRRPAPGEGHTTGGLADLQLPADVWHAYREGDTRTLCKHLQLRDLYLFPRVPFLPVRADVCEDCRLLATSSPDDVTG